MKYNVIAIEREYASGGQEIGRRTAEALGIPCYGREILEIAAQRGGRSPEYLEQLEETATNSLLYSFYRISQQSAQGNMLSNEDALYLAEWKIIQELADQGPAVFVGRCASYVLKRRKDLLSVFVRAGVDFRVERAIREYGIERERAEWTLRRQDKRRASYYSSNTGTRWDDARGYHLTLDSGRLGIEGCVSVLCAAAGAV